MLIKPFRNLIVLSVLLISILFVLPQAVSMYVDWLWFRDLGLERVFTIRLSAQSIAALAGMVVGFLISFANIRFALLAMKGRAVAIPLHGRQDVPPLGFLRHVDRIGMIGPAVIGLFCGFLLGDSWFVILSSLNAVPAGIADPIFERDVSYYLFALPVQELAANGLVFVLWSTAAAVGLVYFVKGAIFLTPRGLAVEPAAIRHGSVIGALFFAVAAWKAWVAMHGILSSSHGHVAGATYADVHAVIPFLKVKAAMALALAIFFLANMAMRRTLFLAAGIAVYLVVSFVGAYLYPAVLQRFVVAPNELVKETPYIRNNIAFTRTAFGLDGVEERNISGSTTLTRQDIRNNSATIKNIRLWDHRPLLDTFGQIQEIRTYYDFASVGNDRYMVNGEYRQTMLSPRELSTESIPTRNWINETLTFTHGYGLTLGPVNQVTPEGLPVLLVKDIPPVSSVESIRVTRPEIYYGRLSSRYVIVNTKSREFDYPSGEENVFTEYAGRSGVAVDSLLKRAAFAAYFRSLKLLLSNDVTRESRILFHRNIMERVYRVMPFLMLDSDPYMVITDDGRLVWLCDAYTVSRRYPYAQPLANGLNYMRNAVKVAVDAYDGSLAFYVADSSDPIIRTVDRIFPGVLRPLAEMPADLRRHIRYPLDIFDVQARMYAVYHMDDPQIFYNKEDQWEIPALGGRDGREPMESYYTIMKLPEEKKEEFILMLPFNPKKKDNLSAWMVARSDGEQYGKMIVYRFPKDRLVYGPKQIVARINQDTEISRQVSLWDQRGSQVIQGTLLVIPVENSLIYVQPLYLRAETGKIPELKRVIVAYENRIAMEETLDAALSRIFGEVRVSGETAPEAMMSTGAGRPEKGLASRAQEHFEQAMKAQREGDWARYGEEIRRLGEVLRKMQ